METEVILLPRPESAAASTRRRQLIHHAAENALRKRLAAFWSRSGEVVAREPDDPFAPFLLIRITGYPAPDYGVWRFQARLEARSVDGETLRHNFARLAALFPFEGGPSPSGGGSEVAFELLETAEGVVFTEDEAAGLRRTAAAMTVKGAIDIGRSTFSSKDEPEEAPADLPTLATLRGDLDPGYGAAVLARLFIQNGLPELTLHPFDRFHDSTVLETAGVEVLNDLTRRTFRYRLRAGAEDGAALRNRLAQALGPLPLYDAELTATQGTTLRIRHLAAAGPLSFKESTLFRRPRHEAELLIDLSVDLTRSRPNSGDLPGNTIRLAASPIDFAALEQAMDDYFVAASGLDEFVDLSEGPDDGAVKPFGIRFTGEEADETGELRTLAFLLEWRKLRRDTALSALSRLEKVFPRYSLSIGGVAFAALLVKNSKIEDDDETMTTHGELHFTGIIIK